MAIAQGRGLWCASESIGGRLDEAAGHAPGTARAWEGAAAVSGQERRFGRTRWRLVLSPRWGEISRLAKAGREIPPSHL
jgi:hypothetical protein